MQASNQYIRTFINTLCVLTMLVSGPVLAEPLEIGGMFAAYKECPAVPNMHNKKNNPGNIKLEKGIVYKVIGADTYSATHYKIIVQGAQPKQRWVPVGCGVLAKVEYEENVYLLSLGWHPGYCKNNPDKSECKYLHPDRYDATNLTLIGLWPQPHSNIYCNVKDQDVKLSKTGDWINLPQLELSGGMKGEIVTYMPRVASSLQRHQWTKHGTCYGTDSEQYYSDSLNLLKRINDDGLNKLMAAHIDQRLSLEDIDEYMLDKYGPQAAGKVAMRCKGGYVTQLWLSIKGDVKAVPVADLLSNAKDVQRSCTEGLVAGVESILEELEHAADKNVATTPSRLDDV